MKFEIDVLHSFPLPAGSELDGVVLADRAFVDAGRHTLVADRAFVEQLDASGYIEILSADGETVVWSACCADGEHDHA